MKNDMKVLFYRAVSSSTISICNGERQVAGKKNNTIQLKNESMIYRPTRVFG